MEKTRIGLSVPVAAALCYLLFTLFGATVGFLFLGCILLCESNVALKRAGLSAGIIYIAFALLYNVVGLLPDAFDLLETIVFTFNGTLDVVFIDKFWTLFAAIFNYAKAIIMLLLAFKAYKGKAVELGFVKKLVG